MLVLEALAINMVSWNPIKVKTVNKTKPTPTRVLNKYACFKNDDDDDDDRLVGCTVANQPPRAGLPAKDTSNKMMTSKGVDERNDDEHGEVDTTQVPVETCELQNTKIKRIFPKPVVLDLGLMVNISKGMPELDNINDDASVVTVATKNSSK